MSTQPTPKPLWTPSPERIERATLTRFLNDSGLDPHDYAAAWEWSVSDLDGFWSAIVEQFGVRFDTGPKSVLGRREMPGAEWFPGARCSWAEHIFRGKDDAVTAILHASELRDLGEWTWGDLRRETARIRSGLKELGVGDGDRVAAYMPNIPETIAVALATASLGAIWSSAPPEFGARAVIDRFAQIEPKVLLAVDGYRYNGRDFDRTEIVSAIHAEAGGELVRFGYLDGSGWPADFGNERDGLRFSSMAFEHPLWVVYSSGTTGLPKPIVHSQGGILLEHLKMMHLHLDAQPGDRAFWFTTTGWMMWNFLLGVLLSDAAIVLYDGNPVHPGLDTLWDLAERTRMTCFGTSAGYIASCMKAGFEPAAGRDLSALRSVGSTGSPLAPEGFQWVYDQLGEEIWLFSTSGGTDMCTAFVGGVPTLPVYSGELQARALGAKLEVWDPEGRSLIDEVGELVITEPMPSMPISFWNDPDGERYRESYFSMYPGVWRHGDWIEITSRGSAIIHGRSDSTINRGGVRMGTSEIYSAVLRLEEITDALVVDVDGWMPLFVVLAGEAELNDELKRRIAARIREDCSPRHVPSEVLAVNQIPRTLTGKVLEVPVKRILMGSPPEKAASRDTLADPQALDWFADFAARRAESGENDR
jgi:acetoacetyl-CoA synthetase